MSRRRHVGATSANCSISRDTSWYPASRQASMTSAKCGCAAKPATPSMQTTGVRTTCINAATRSNNLPSGVSRPWPFPGAAQGWQGGDMTNMSGAARVQMPCQQSCSMLAVMFNVGHQCHRGKFTVNGLQLCFRRYWLQVRVPWSAAEGKGGPPFPTSNWCESGPPMWREAR